MTHGSTWRNRWEKAVQYLNESRQEAATLRAALDDLNSEVEGMLNVAGQSGIESAKSWLIKSQREALRKHRATATPPIKFAHTTPEEHGLQFTGPKI
jgi:1,2-phenylacetyl-CoA epoxidase catalytic subunit